MPELISREVGLKEKKSLKTGKCNFCILCKTVVPFENIEAHIMSKTHIKKKKNNSQVEISEENNGIRIME